MPQHTELKAVFLYQVKIGQSFYCYPSDSRTWIRLRPVVRPVVSGTNGWTNGPVVSWTNGPVEVISLPVANVPVQGDGVQVYMNGMFNVWVRADEDTSHVDKRYALEVSRT